jgi:signal peptidase II
MFYILIVVAIVFAETKIKNYIEKNKQPGDQQEILNGKIIIKKQYNRGMFLNFLEDKKEMVKTMTGVFLGLLLLLFAVMLPKKGSRLFKLGLSLCLGGAISNATDRFNRGYVIDYFSFNCKRLKNIVFNLSDIFILLGSFLILLSSVFCPKGKSCSDKTAE